MTKSRLKLTRETAGLTQKQLAEKSGVDIRLIQHYEQGSKDINNAKCITVLQLAEALECDIYDIINPREYESSVIDTANRPKRIVLH